MAAFEGGPRAEALRMAPFSQHLTAFALAELTPDGPAYTTDFDLDQEDVDLVEVGAALEIALPGRW